MIKQKCLRWVLHLQQLVTPNEDQIFLVQILTEKTISLKESLGKVTIVDFWASWCSPCRAENPNMVLIYNEFHKKGLNIVGVSLDREAAKWKEAIAKDKLNWVQISHLKFWEEPIAIQYEVQEIPATFILDASGKLVAKNLRGEELRAKIAELLSK